MLPVLVCCCSPLLHIAPDLSTLSPLCRGRGRTAVRPVTMASHINFHERDLGKCITEEGIKMLFSSNLFNQRLYVIIIMRRVVADSQPVLIFVISVRILEETNIITIFAAFDLQLCRHFTMPNLKFNHGFMQIQFCLLSTRCLCTYCTCCKVHLKSLLKGVL